MKLTNFFLTLTFILMISCDGQQEISSVNSLKGDSNKKFIDITLDKLDNIDINTESFSSRVDLGKKVDLYSELLDLFDTDNFDCGYNSKLKKKLKKYKPKNRDESGFIPNIVLKNAFFNDSIILLDRKGSNILAHGFQYLNADGRKSKLIFASESPTVRSFNEIDYIEKNPSGYDNFLYTLDCSGFLSTAVSAVLGISRKSIQTSASIASKTEKSLVVLGGLMYSPLYQAYSGEGRFKTTDSILTLERIKVLESILKVIPSQHKLDTTKIFIDVNFEVLLASNSGSSGFNGKADINTSGNGQFGIGSVSGEANIRGSIQRKSNFSKFKTYINQINVNREPEEITVESLNSRITQLKNNL